MRHTLALLLLCVITVSAFAGCLQTQQHTSDHTNASVTSVASGSSTSHTTGTHYRVSVGTATVDAEAADTPAKLEIGLMGRTGLDPNAGMLFLFSNNERQAMWMKNMQFPIDIVFISDDLRVQRVYAEVPPCTADPCPTYVSDGPVRYALEVRAGFCAEHNIVRGAQVTITPS